jgi:tetratricopeptide (TPR) repeat protein
VAKTFFRVFQCIPWLKKIKGVTTLLMKTKQILTAVLILNLSALCMAATETKPELLKKAWLEYKLGEYSQAEKLFTQAKTKAKDNKSYCEATTGVAFCYQYAKKQQTAAGDYRYAIELYGQALKKIDRDSKYRPFFTAMRAECYFNIYRLTGEKNNLNEAVKLWDEIQQKWSTTVAGQDALLYQVMAMTGDDYSTPEALKLAEQLERYLETNKIIQPKHGKKTLSIAKKQLLAAVMSNYLGDFYFWREDYRNAVKWLINYYELGASSYAYKADVLFKIARTADIKLKDKPLAIKYYTLFQDEIKSNTRRYFAQQRIISLNKDAKK